MIINNDDIAVEHSYVEIVSFLPPSISELSLSLRNKRLYLFGLRIISLDMAYYNKVFLMII